MTPTARNGNCAGAILRQDGQVLLGVRSASKANYPNCWDVFGGGVEPGESLEAALERELKEELGIRPTSYLRFASLEEPDPRRHGVATYHLFLVMGWDGEPSLLGDEHNGMEWFSAVDISRLHGLALPELRETLIRAAGE